MADELKNITLFGITSKEQAERVAKWIKILGENPPREIEFRVDPNKTKIEKQDLIRVKLPDYNEDLYRVIYYDKGLVKAVLDDIEINVTYFDASKDYEKVSFKPGYSE